MNNESLRLRTLFVLVRHGSRTPCHPHLCFNVEFTGELIEHPAHTFTPIQAIYQKEEESGSIPRKSSEAVYDGVYLKGGQCKPGQLAGKGAQGQFLRGEKLRHHYVDEKKFLSSDYMSDEVLVQSSYFERTIESSRSMLAGLYPQRSSSATPIPIHVSKPIENFALPTNPYLPYIASSLRDNPGLVPGMKDATDKAKEILKLDGALDLSYLWDNLKTLKELDLLPKLPDEIWDLCSNWGSKWFEMRTIGTEKCRYAILQMGSGMFIDFMLHKIKDLQDGKPVHKLHLLTGHDHTLWCLMHILKMKDIEMPPSTNSTLALEVYDEEHGDKVYVRVVFNGQMQQVAENDNVDLELEEFLSLVEKYRLTKEDHKHKCDNFRPNLRTCF